MAAYLGVSAADVARYRLLGLSWTEVGRVLGLTNDRIRSWRRATGFEDPLSRISDAVLLSILLEYCTEYPDGRGQNSVQGHLLALSLLVPRSQLVRVIRSNEVLSEARNQRYYRAYRRERGDYVSRGPGDIHHADTNLKLGRWGFSLFGVIDGFSHEILVLRVTTDHKAATVLESYVTSERVARRGLPSRFRIDCGMENMAVGRFLWNMGVHVIPGPSPANVRIERLWGDVMKDVSSFYRKKFQLYELPLARGGLSLDPGDPEHIWVIQYVFGDRIAQQLEVFIDSWNNHQQRLLGFRTPLQLVSLCHDQYYASILEPERQELARAALHSLEGEYIGNGKLSSNRSPFVSMLEWEQFTAVVHPLSLDDAEDTFVSRIDAAIACINTIKGLREQV